MRVLCICALAFLLAIGAYGVVATGRSLSLSELTLPPGFEISIYAQGLPGARMLAFSPTGVLFVSDLGGRVMVVPEAGRIQTFAINLRQPHGLVFRGNDLYVAENQ